MDKATALLHASRGAQGDTYSLLSALRAALLGDGMATYAGNPNSNVTPANVGEMLFDSTNLAFYRASTTANTGWEVISVAGLTAEEILSNDISLVCERFDDFTGDTLDASWDSKLGTDGSCAVAIAVGLSGLLRITGGAAATSALSINGSQFQGSLNWQANQGGLVIEARIKPTTTVSNSQLYIGMTDQTASLEMPLTVANGQALPTNSADDAFGFMFNDLSTTSAKDWYMGGVKATTKTAITAVGAPPRSGTFQTLRIECSAAGSAAFYVDGVLKATIANAVTITAPLTPAILLVSQTNSAKTLDVDYIKIRQLR